MLRSHSHGDCHKHRTPNVVSDGLHYPNERVVVYEEEDECRRPEYLGHQHRPMVVPEERERVEVIETTTKVVDDYGNVRDVVYREEVDVETDVYRRNNRGFGLGKW